MVRDGEITARELVEASLSRIDALNPTYNAFVDVFHDEALAAADGIGSRGLAAVRRRPDRDQEQPPRGEQAAHVRLIDFRRLRAADDAQCSSSGCKEAGLRSSSA